MSAMPPTGRPKIVAGYMRRSSADAENDGRSSREAQEAAIRRMCPDAVLYTDWGISGGKASRPEYQRLRRDIEAGTVESVCTYSLSRIARNLAELLSFVELCKAHGVVLRSSVESVDTSSAAGNLFLAMMGAVGQFELEVGRERSGAGRAAYVARQEAAGVPIPKGKPFYGEKAMKGPDGLVRVGPDPDRPIEPILEAYAEAGSVSGAAVLLSGRVPAPRGGNVWAVSTLRAILEHYAETRDIVPPPRGRGHRAERYGIPALFAGLLHCSCGRLMTPNRARGQYYCSSGRMLHGSFPELHGSYTVSERRLQAVLRPEAERYDRSILATHEGSKPAAEAKLVKKRDQFLDLAVAHPNLAARYSAEIAKLDAELAEIALRARTKLILKLEPIPSWDDVAAMNAHLRHIWTVVRLDESLRPIVTWNPAARPLTDAEWEAENSLDWDGART